MSVALMLRLIGVLGPLNPYTKTKLNFRLQTTQPKPQSIQYFVFTKYYTILTPCNQTTASRKQAMSLVEPEEICCYLSATVCIYCKWHILWRYIAQNMWKWNIACYKSSNKSRGGALCWATLYYWIHPNSHVGINHSPATHRNKLFSAI